MNRTLRAIAFLAALAPAAFAAAEAPAPRLMEAGDAALLLLDHQTGLFQTVS